MPGTYSLTAHSIAGYSLVLGIVYLVFGLIEVFGVLERQYQGMYFRPEIWLFLASLPLVYQAWKLTRDLIW